MERETGFEPATSTLARSHSTTELLPLSNTDYTKRNEGGSNRRPSMLWRIVRHLRIFRGWHNFSVAHVNDAIAEGRRLRIVRDHQHRLAEFPVRLPQHIENHIGVFSIEVAGRL